MRMGLLWFDSGPGRSLAEKIGEAARRHKQKYGSDPNAVYVHPSALDDDGQPERVGKVRVKPSPSVLLHHLWIGREEEPE